MAAPILENDWTVNDSGEAATDTITLTKPAGAAVGNLLLLIVGSDQDNVADWNTVTGWTQFININDAAGDANVACYWRICDGTEASTVDVTGATVEERYGWYIRVSGVDTTTPIHLVGTPLYQTTSPYYVPQITTTVDDCLIFYALAFDGGDGFPFTVSGVGGWAEVDDQQSGTAGTDASGCWGTKTMSGQGATGDAGVFSTVDDGTSSIQFAVAPAAGGTTNYQTIAATAIGTGVLARANSFYRALSTVAVGVNVLSRVNSFYRTLTSTTVGTPVLSRVSTFYKTLTSTAIGTAVLSYAKMFTRALSAVASGTAVLSKVPTFVKSLVATTVGTPTLSTISTFYRSLTSTTTATPVLVKKMYQTLAATAIGTGILSLAKLFTKSLTSVALGVASLTRVQTYGKILATTAIGVSSLAKTATHYRILASTAIGSGALATVSSFYRTLSATATGVSTIAKVATHYKTLVVSAVSSAILVAEKLAGVTYYKTLAAVATASVSLRFTLGWILKIRTAATTSQDLNFTKTIKKALAITKLSASGLKITSTIVEK